jgi:hypothetical protein
MPPHFSATYQTPNARVRAAKPQRTIRLARKRLIKAIAVKVSDDRRPG